MPDFARGRAARSFSLKKKTTLHALACLPWFLGRCQWSSFLIMYRTKSLTISSCNFPHRRSLLIMLKL